MIAVLFNLAGSIAMRVGKVLHWSGLALCGLAGELDARADITGYWTPRRVERLHRRAS